MLKRKKIINSPFWINRVTGQSIPAGQISKQQRETFEYFDSVLEYKVYLSLCKKYGEKYITRQFQVPILPKNAFFPALTWKVDFVAWSAEGVLLFEAKGEWLLHDNFALSDFKKLLRLLQITQPEYFKKLVLVSDTEWLIPGTELKVISFNDLWTS